MKRSKGIIIFIVLLLVVAAVALLGYAYLKTDTFLSPEQKFAKYLLGNYMQLSEFNAAPYDEFTERMATESSISETVIKQKNTQEGITEGTDNVITVKTLLDPVAGQEQVDINAKTSNVEIFDMTMALTDTRIGLKVPDLHEKYIALDTVGLRDFAKNTFSLEEDVAANIPDQINLFSSIKPMNEEQKDKLNVLLERYGNRILELLGEQIFINETVQTITIEETTYEANKYALSLTMQQLASIYTTISTEMFNDPEVETILLECFPNIKYAELKASNEKVITEINKLKQDTAITLAVYESDMITRKTELSLSNVGSFEFYVINSDITSKIVFSLVMQKNDTVKVGMTENVIITNEVQNNVSNLSVETKATYNQDDITALKTETDSSEDSLFYDDEYYAQMYKDTSSKVLIRTNKLDNNSIKSTINLSGDGFESAKDMNISSTIKLNQTVKFDEFTDENTLVINKFSPFDYLGLGSELITNAANTAKERPESLVGSLYSLAALFIDLPTVTDTEEQDAVQKEVEDAINNILLAYRFASKGNTEENIADYLTVDNIQSKCSQDLTVEFYDGETLKCTKNGNVYFVKFVINGTTFMLESTEINYSEDGTYEGISSNSNDASIDMSTFGNMSVDTGNPFSSLMEY